MGNAACLGKRADRICREEKNGNQELIRLKNVLKKNGITSIKTVDRRLFLNGSRHCDSGGRTPIAVPYVAGVIEKLLKVTNDQDRFRA